MNQYLFGTEFPRVLFRLSSCDLDDCVVCNCQSLTIIDKTDKRIKVH